jgi:hypothetical protein
MVVLWALRFEADAKRVVATRDIEAGDEFLQDYRAIARVGWREPKESL